MRSYLPMVWAAAVAAGCGGSQSPAALDTGAIAALDRNSSPQITPQGAAAAVYESKAAEARRIPPLDEPLRAGLVEALQRAAGSRGVSVLADERLDEAMSDLARALRPEEQPRSDAVEFLLGYHGIIEPYPQLLVVSVPEQEYDQAVQELLDAAELPPAAKTVTVGVGIDRSLSLHTIVVAIQAKHLDLQPVQRAQESGARLMLQGRLLGSFSRPKLYVTSPAGQPSERPLNTNGVDFKAAVSCAQGDGRYQVEVFGSDPSGPRVLANFPVFCGVTPPDSVDGRAGYETEYSTSDAAEAALFASVNAARATAGLAPVEPDPALAEVARAHSQDMFDNDFFAHISPTTGRPIDRTYKAGLRVPRLLENIGTAGSAEEVHAGLMRSPGHRAAILDPRVKYVGIGVVVPEPGKPFRIIATELFR